MFLIKLVRFMNCKYMKDFLVMFFIGNIGIYMWNSIYNSIAKF